MRRLLPTAAISAAATAVALASCGGEGPAGRTAAAATFARDAGPYVAAHCAGCHTAAKKPANVVLDDWTDDASVRARTALLRKVRDAVQLGQMPPRSKPRPPEAATRAFLAWVDAALAPPSSAAAGGAAAGGASVDPGRVTMRRLNRAEYRNTVRDLLGVEYPTGDEFPADDVGYGFDNVGDVLSTPPILLEKYVKAAERIADKAIVVDDPDHPTARRYEAKSLPSTAPGGARKGMRALVSNGECYTLVKLPRDGEYVLRARAWAQQAGPEPARMAFAVDAKPAATVDVLATEDAPEVYEAHVRATAGLRRVGVAFVNDFYDPKNPDPKSRDRNLIVDTLEILGPVDALATASASHRRIFGPDPGGADLAARSFAVLRPLASRAFRRPATDDEVARLAALVDDAVKGGDRFERGVQVALRAILVSPHFLFRVETHPSPSDPKAVRALTDAEVASRLSYFLWSSMPDDALFEAAAKGAVAADPAGQVERMLRDPRASALTSGFADQWLELRRLATTVPDPQRFPEFDDALKADMLRETEMFFEAVVWEDRSVLDFLDAPFTFLNERLARHYGIAGVEGDRFRRVALDGDRRGGVVTQASVLTITSYPTRTSPVKRGKWLLDEVLFAPTPPPPPGVGVLKDEGPKPAASLRERLAAHRENPDCASCHARLDPLGFALEGYDAIGRFREKDGAFPVDASGSLPDGRSFSGPKDLRALLRADDGFVRGFAAKLLTYALGRGVEEYDAPALERIVAQAKAGGLRFSAFVRAIVASDPFAKARGEESKP